MLTLRQRGFTLIEMMMTLAIIGVLAAIAIPAYEEYRNRTKVVSGIAEISAGKLEFESIHNNNGSVTAAAQINLPNDTANCTITVANNAEIICTIKNAPVGTNNKTVTLERTGDSIWQCKAPTIATRYKPEYCS